MMFNIAVTQAGLNLVRDHASGGHSSWPFLIVGFLIGFFIVVGVSSGTGGR